MFSYTQFRKIMHVGIPIPINYCRSIPCPSIGLREQTYVMWNGLYTYYDGLQDLPVTTCQQTLYIHIECDCKNCQWLYVPVDGLYTYWVRLQDLPMTVRASRRSIYILSGTAIFANDCTCQQTVYIYIEWDCKICQWLYVPADGLYTYWVGLRDLPMTVRASRRPVQRVQGKRERSIERAWGTSPTPTPTPTPTSIVMALFLTRMVYSSHQCPSY